MKFTRWTIALYMGVVFLSGAVLGGLGYRLYSESSVSANAQRNPEEFRRRYMDEMRSRLKLSDDQASKLSAILDETRMRFRATRDTIEPEMQRIREEQQEKVHTILRPEQIPEYEKMRKERDEEIRRRGLPPPR